MRLNLMRGTFLLEASDGRCCRKAPLRATPLALQVKIGLKGAME
jgi:hypothetical protein